MTSYLNVFIDGDESLEKFARMIAALTGVNLQRHVHGNMVSFGGSRDKSFITAEINDLQSLPTGDISDYRLRLNSTPFTGHGMPRYKDWVPTAGVRLFEELRILDRSFLMYADGMGKLVEYVPPRLWVAPSHFEGPPSEGKRAYVFIGSERSLEDIVDSVESLLAVRFESWVNRSEFWNEDRTECEVLEEEFYTYEDDRVEMKLEPTGDPREWPLSAVGYQYVLEVRPRSVASRRAWEEWMERGGRSVYERLKALDRPLRFMDGPWWVLGEHLPERESRDDPWEE